MYLGLHRDPTDPEYSLYQRASLCYVANAVSLVLKKAKTSTQLGLDSSLNHPTHAYIMPLISKICVPFVR